MVIKVFWATIRAMRTTLFFAGSTVGSIAFQLSVAVWPDVFHKYAWTVKYVWLLWGVIWLVWIVTHPSIVGGWLRAQPLPAGAGASSNVSGSPNVTAGSVAVGRDAYFGYPPSTTVTPSPADTKEKQVQHVRLFLDRVALGFRMLWMDRTFVFLQCRVLSPNKITSIISIAPSSKPQTGKP